MDFGEVLSRAWQIIWKHKVLWIFGILAGCVNSGGGASNSRMNYNGKLPSGWEGLLETIPQWQIIAYAGIALLVLLLIVVLVVFLGTIGRIGLFRGAQQSDADMETKLSFGELFRGSFPYFWRVFLLNLLVGLIVFSVVVVLSIIFIMGTVMTLGIGLVCLIPLICLLIPVAFFITLVVEQSNLAIVIDNLGIMDGLRRGWVVVKSNAGIMVIMWLILTLGVGMLGGFIIALPLVISIAPLFVALFFGAREFSQPGIWIPIVCTVAYLPFLILLSGILRSYVESAWTLTYLRVTKGLTSILPDHPQEVLPAA